MKKRMVTLILALLLALSLTGCGSRDTAKDSENAGIGTQSTDDASTFPDTAQDRPVTDAPMMVMVDNTLYQSAGEVSTVEGRCGAAFPVVPPKRRGGAPVCCFWERRSARRCSSGG